VSEDLAIAGEDLADDRRITAMGLFGEAYSGLTARFSAQFAAHGLAPIEFEVLIRLARSPGHQLRMSDLSAQTSLTTSGVTRVVDRLERGGLVARIACPSDRRSMYAVLTAEGQCRLDAILPGHLEMIDQTLISLLSPEQLDGFLAALRIIRDAVRPGATAGTALASPE
jgi:DNA-binding MarR family transcriptional regulator